MHDAGADIGAKYDAWRAAPNGAASADALWIDDEGWIETDIPRRPWVVPGYALRGAVTVVCGPPSALKSSLVLGWACALALQYDFGRFRPLKVGTTLIYNVEDDQMEQRRRLSATLRHFPGATPASIKGRIIRTGPAQIGTLLTRDDRGGIHVTPAMERLEALIEERQLDILVVDPLSELHNAEENDNTALRAVIAEFRRLAIKHNIAVIILHHTRKGSATPGDPEMARGASAVIGAARLMFTITGMAEEDATALRRAIRSSGEIPFRPPGQCEVYSPHCVTPSGSRRPHTTSITASRLLLPSRGIRLQPRRHHRLTSLQWPRQSSVAHRAASRGSRSYPKTRDQSGRCWTITASTAMPKKPRCNCCMTSAR